MLPGLAAAGRLSSQRVLLENESFAKRARLDGSTLLPLRRFVRALPEEDQHVRVVDRHPSSHWPRLRGMARQFLHLRPAGTPGELSHSQEVAQNRSDQAVRIDRGSGG